MLVDNLLASFKVYLQIDPSDSSEDNFLTEILLSTESFIYEYYGVAILERNLTEFFTFNGKFIYTKRGYIKNLVSIKENGEAVNDLTVYYSDRNKIVPPSYLAYGTKVSVEYTVGYSDIDSISYGLRAGLFIFGKKIYTDATKNSDNYAQISSNIKENVKFVEELPLIADNLLSPMKVFRL